MMRRFPIDKLDLFFSKVAENEKLYIPSDAPGGAEFTEWREGVKLTRALNTVRSAKDFFFPQTENLVEFKLKGKEITLTDPRRECEDFVIFGVRACDVRSFAILDRVFLADQPDTYYMNRRRHSTIVSLACTRPSETCFCGTFGIDAAEPGGDVAAYMTDSYVYLDPKTEKGTRLLDSLGDMTEECDSSDVEEQKKLISDRMNALPLKDLKADGFGKGKTAEFFDAPEWKELSRACLGCGTCTFVCPTCQCYDIKDFNTGNGVIRFRCWDSCMYSDFTLMAHGNSRNSQLERFRQRFMHKLVYYPENNDGVFSCVGCGRCLSKCPISMNIVKVMKALGGDKNDA